MDPQIRPAIPADAPFLAWVIQEAARSHLPFGIWDLAFPGADGQRLERLAAFAVTEALHFAHYSRFLVATVDGTPAAALSAYENASMGGAKLGLGMAEAFRNLGLPGKELLAVGARLAPLEALGLPTPDGLWIVEWVATLPAYRGRGLVRELLQAILEGGRAEGYTRTQIAYLVGNTPARHAYQRAGFEDIDVYEHADFEKAFGTPGIARMQRAL